MNCQSGTNSGVRHARKSLSAIANRSAISRRLVLCVFSQPYWSQFYKLIFVTDQENFRPFDNAGKKLVACGKFALLRLPIAMVRKITMTTGMLASVLPKVAL